MTKQEIAKSAIKFVVGSSTGAVVTKLVKSHSSPDNIVEELQLVVAGYALGGVVADRTVDWADAKFTGLMKAIEQFKSQEESEEE